MWACKILLIKIVLFIPHFRRPKDFDPCSSWIKVFTEKKKKSILEDHCGCWKRENKITVQFKGILFPKLSGFKILMHLVDGADVPILPFGVSRRWGKASAWHIFIRNPKKKPSDLFPNRDTSASNPVSFHKCNKPTSPTCHYHIFSRLCTWITRIYHADQTRAKICLTLYIIIRQCLCDFFQYILPSSSREAKVIYWIKHCVNKCIIMLISVYNIVRDMRRRGINDTHSRAFWLMWRVKDQFDQNSENNIKTEPNPGIHLPSCTLPRHLLVLFLICNRDFF